MSILFTCTRNIHVHITLTEAMNSLHIKYLALFPGRSHRQYSSMKYGVGRPGRSGHVQCLQVDRHMVNTRRAVPNEESQRPVLHCLSKGWMSERSQGIRSIPFIVHNSGDRSMRNRHHKWLGTAPRVSTICLPVITCDQISQADEILAVGTAWE